MSSKTLKTSGKRSSGSSSSQQQQSKKHKEQRALNLTLSDGGSRDKEVSTLNKLHQGKRLLIPARGVYGSKGGIPPAETNYLFVYSFRKINPDGDDAAIDFESKYIEVGGSQWMNYADTAAEDADIDSELLNYDYKTNLNKDHERYNSYLSKINKVINDKHEEEQEKLKEVGRSELDNIQAIVDQYVQRTDEPKERCYQILVNKFEPAGPLEDHIIGGSGMHAGKQSKKQKWDHKFSSQRPFVWHYKQGQDFFDRSTLWKQSLKIQSESWPGSARLANINEFKSGNSGGVLGGAKMSRDQDMVNQVFAVFAAIGSKSPLAIFDNERMEQYLRNIALGHAPHHRLERNHITCVLMDSMMLEISKILSERRHKLHNGFVSGTINGWTDSHRKESFMAFVRFFC